MQSVFGQRAPFADVRRVGIPRALLYYRYGIAWRTFFEQLGREVVLDSPSDRGTLEVGDRLSVDECCLASKLFLGHVAALAGRCDAVFIPSLMGYGRFETFCTKFQALPDLAENSFAVAGESLRVISMRVEEPRGTSEEDAYLGVAAELGVTRKEGRRAYRAAIAAQRAYDERMALRAGAARQEPRQAARRGAPTHHPRGGAPLREPRSLCGRRGRGRPARAGSVRALCRRDRPRPHPQEELRL